ncbi:unnamed protein product [Sphagnum troendelagicum]
MAVGKNKRISKGKKGGKKKLSIRFQIKIGMTSRRHQHSTRDRWANSCHKNPRNQDGLKGRVFEVSLADLQQDEDQAFRKIKLRADDVQGRNGMDFTTDKLWSLVHKWQSLIESHMDVKTTDNYMLCIFCIGFTKKRPNQIKHTCYAQSSEICQILRKMREIMVREAQSCDLKELVAKFIPEVIGKEIERQHLVHGDYSEEIGAKIEHPVGDDAETDAEPVEVPGA